MKSIVEGSLWDSERGRGRVGERDPLGSCMIWNCSSTMSERTVSGVSQALFESAWPEEFPHHSQCSGSCSTMSGQRLGPASLEKKVKGRARKKARAKRASSHSWAKPGVYLDFPDSQIDFQWPWPSAAWSRVSVIGIEVESEQWEHQILTTWPVVSNKALALWLCRKEFPQDGK